ncbi:protein Iojap-related, mitochondrial [Cicer arietinum]|uniref:Protein Iojap-related, mitochondrial n=1 Tax=Cicer arietinum TaxID=3827 RepID=A0A1S2YBC6_CICAR|nr:protein Iojap-related, mitochondrial [Cicer arietinum]
MLALLRARCASNFHTLLQPWKLGFSSLSTTINIDGGVSKCVLDLQEIEKVLTDVKADDVKVIPVPEHCDWADYMVLATGRSTWHVKNIAQALIYKAKQKQKGVERMMLPSVEGSEGGKWIVIDSGKVIVHALDEKARAYYNLENLWTHGSIQHESTEDLQKVLVKVRRKNNSKKPAQKNA